MTPELATKLLDGAPAFRLVYPDGLKTPPAHASTLSGTINALRAKERGTPDAGPLQIIPLRRLVSGGATTFDKVC